MPDRLSKAIRIILAVSLVCGVFTLGMIFALYSMMDFINLGQGVYREVLTCELKHGGECRVEAVPTKEMNWL